MDLASELIEKALALRRGNSPARVDLPAPVPRRVHVPPTRRRSSRTWRAGRHALLRVAVFQGDGRQHARVRRHRPQRAQPGGRHARRITTAWVAMPSPARHVAHILDTVPNHVGVATNDNGWWNDVLENGPGVDGMAASSTSTGTTLAAPSCAARCCCRCSVSRTASAGRRQAQADLRGRRVLRLYYDRRFPLSPRTYADASLGAGELTAAALGADAAAVAEYRSILRDAGRPSPEDSDGDATEAGVARDKESIKQRLAALAAASTPFAS